MNHEKSTTVGSILDETIMLTTMPTDLSLESTSNVPDLMQNMGDEMKVNTTTESGDIITDGTITDSMPDEDIDNEIIMTEKEGNFDSTSDAPQDIGKEDKELTTMSTDIIITPGPVQDQRELLTTISSDEESVTVKIDSASQMPTLDMDDDSNLSTTISTEQDMGDATTMSANIDQETMHQSSEAMNDGTEHFESMTTDIPEDVTPEIINDVDDATKIIDIITDIIEDFESDLNKDITPKEEPSTESGIPDVTQTQTTLDD